uniref:Uncharacterized protein n=1 Tax=Myotis myotis TaxID=51298 RepID=A0A7J7SR45_MYOMY|nr:hypothetical protein mMyoMyo1_009314 [Myotis myotis]
MLVGGNPADLKEKGWFLRLGWRRPGGGGGEKAGSGPDRGDVAALAHGLVPGLEIHTLPRPFFPLRKRFHSAGRQLLVPGAATEIVSSRKESFERSHELPHLFHPDFLHIQIPSLQGVWWELCSLGILCVRVSPEPPAQMVSEPGSGTPGLSVQTELHLTMSHSLLAPGPLLA